MIPYLLAAVGGYLIGQSRKEDVFADGGMIFKKGERVLLKDGGGQRIATIVEDGYDSKNRVRVRPEGFPMDLSIPMEEKYSDDKRLYIIRKMADGGRVRTNSIEVRQRVKQHILDSVYDYNENRFDNFDDAAQFLADDFERVADYEYNMRRFPNNQKRFEDYLRGIPFNFEYYNDDIRDFLNGLGINPKNKEYSPEEMWNLYSYLIWREVVPKYRKKFENGGMIEEFVNKIAEENKSKKFSLNNFHKLRNKEYQKLVDNSKIQDTDKNFKKFDVLLGEKLNVDYEYEKGGKIDNQYTSVEDLRKRFEGYSDEELQIFNGDNEETLKNWNRKDAIEDAINSVLDENDGDQMAKGGGIKYSLDYYKMKLDELDPDGNIDIQYDSNKKEWYWEDYAKDTYKTGFKKQKDAFDDVLGYLEEKMAKGGKVKFNVDDIQVGDYVNFGQYGNFYVANTDFDELGGGSYFWVTKDKDKRNKSNAMGKTMHKSDAEYIIEKYSDAEEMAKGGEVEIIVHGKRREYSLGKFKSTAAAKRYLEEADLRQPYTIKKLSVK